MTPKKSKARQYTDITLKRLFALSGNECAFPSCKTKIAQPDTKSIVAQICHIEAAEPGGERYNSLQTDEDRRHFDNLILLCPTHHVVTNDETVYTVEVLKQYKKDHESKMLLKLSDEGLMNKYPTGLVMVINQISSTGLINESLEWDEVLNSFKIEEKIKYNDIKTHTHILDEYKVYHGKLNMIYEQIEIEGSFKKEQLLRNIKRFYMEAKGKLTDGTIESIRLNADNLIDEVEKSLWDAIEKSNNLNNGVLFEVIELSIQIIIVDAFMRCKILEEPQ